VAEVIRGDPGIGNWHRLSDKHTALAFNRLFHFLD